MNQGLTLCRCLAGQIPSAGLINKSFNFLAFPILSTVYHSASRFPTAQKCC